MSDHLRPRHKVVMTCHNCGGRMLRSWQPEVYTYKDVPITYGQPGWFCVDCPEAVVTGKDMNPGERAMKAALIWLEDKR